MNILVGLGVLYPFSTAFLSKVYVMPIQSTLPQLYSYSWDQQKSGSIEKRR